LIFHVICNNYNTHIIIIIIVFLIVILFTYSQFEQICALKTYTSMIFVHSLHAFMLACACVNGPEEKGVMETKLQHPNLLRAVTQGCVKCYPGMCKMSKFLKVYSKFQLKFLKYFTPSTLVIPNILEMFAANILESDSVFDCFQGHI